MTSAPFSPQCPLVLVGCGSMGGAMLAGWHHHREFLAGPHWHDSVWVVVRNPEKRLDIAARYDVKTSDSFASLPDTFSGGLMVLAVKPHQLDTVLADISAHPSSKTSAAVSVAAGKTISFLSDRLPKGAPVARAMPNTPSLVGKGITGCVAGPHISAEHRHLVSACFEALGQCHWLEGEDDMHRFTALCGCGPAFVFYLMECLTRHAHHIGVAPEAAFPILRQLIEGSVALAATAPNHIGALREQVTSKGGVTAAGLERWMDAHTGLAPLLDDTLERARHKSEQLAE